MSEQQRIKCRDCRGEGVFWMMSEFPVPCSTCKGRGFLAEGADKT